MRIGDWSSDVCSSDIIRAQIEIGSAERLDVEARLEAVPRLRVETGIAAGNPIDVHGLPAHVIEDPAVGGRDRRIAELVGAWRPLSVVERHLQDRKSTRLNSSH